MAIQYQYDPEAHLGYIITFLFHPRKFNLRCAGETVRPKNWRDENCINLKRDIDQWRQKVSIVYIVIDDETFAFMYF